MNSFFPTENFSSALRVALDYADCGGADMTEALGAAEKIRDGDCESWHLAWIALAEQVRRGAAQDLSGGSQRTARDGFLRAAHYYRTAGHFLTRNPHDARIATTAGAGGACFATAMRLSAPACETHLFEVAGTRRTAYLHRADGAEPGRPTPTLLVIGEAGTTPLELYFACARAANRCGWNCLAVSGAEKGEADTLADSLLSVALRLDSVDPGCLALMRFRAEPVAATGTGSRRLACFLAMGSAETVQESLHRKNCRESLPSGDTADMHAASDSLPDFHQRLVRWLGSAD